MALRRVTIHEAIPVRTTEAGPRIQGEQDYAIEPGTPFRCFLIFTSASTEDKNSPRGRRKIVRPQILFEGRDEGGEVVNLTAEDEVAVTAPELTGPDPVHYTVTGDPLPFAKPGQLKGYQAFLQKVTD